jgi:tight adherence protein B
MIAALFFCATVLIVVGFGMLAAPLLAGNASRKRALKRLDRASGRDALPAPGSVNVTVRREVADSSIKALDQLIKRTLPRRPAQLRERLASTGKRISLSEYVLACMVTGGVCYLAAHLAGLSPFLAAMLALAGSFYLPWAQTGRMIASRQRKFIALFADAIELMVRGLKSGIPVGESIRVVGQEIADPVGVEFRAITDGLHLGQTYDEALQAASNRIDLPEFRFFVVTINIQQETGGNLAETLENLAGILRKRKQMKLKVKALSSEARASAYIIGALPFLMFAGLTAINPEYMNILFHDRRGNVVLAMAIGSLMTGVMTMIKMGKLDI